MAVSEETFVRIKVPISPVPGPPLVPALGIKNHVTCWSESSLNCRSIVEGMLCGLRHRFEVQTCVQTREAHLHPPENTFPNLAAFFTSSPIVELTGRKEAQLVTNY